MHSTTSAVDLSDRDSKETLVVKEEETYDAGVFEKVEAEVVKLLGCRSGKMLPLRPDGAYQRTKILNLKIQELQERSIRRNSGNLTPSANDPMGRNVYRLRGARTTWMLPRTGTGAGPVCPVGTETPPSRKPTGGLKVPPCGPGPPPLETDRDVRGGPGPLSHDGRLS